MSRSLRRALYREDLEVCAHLYEQRQLHLEHPRTRLRAVAELEDRLDGHVSALARGRELAAEVCLEALDTARSGQVYAATRALCRGDAPSVLAHFEAVVAHDPPLGHAVEAALSCDMPRLWLPALERALDSPQLGPLVARAAGSRRTQALGPGLTRRVLELEARVPPSYVWALGEMRCKPALAYLRPLLGQSKSQRLWTTTALACLKLDDRKLAARLRSSEALTRWSPLGQVLCAQVPCTWLLAELARWPGPEIIIALALRGDPRCIPALIDCLAEPKLAHLASGALFLLSGAPLLELGDTPDKGEHSGAAHWRLSTNTHDWRTWLTLNPHSWEGATPRRLGRPLDRRSSSTAALCCALPLPFRAAVFDALALRFSADPRLRPHAPARAVLEALSPHADPPPVFEPKGPILSDD